MRNENTVALENLLVGKVFIVDSGDYEYEENDEENDEDDDGRN